MLTPHVEGCLARELRSFGTESAIPLFLVVCVFSNTAASTSVVFAARPFVITQNHAVALDDFDSLLVIVHYYIISPTSPIRSAADNSAPELLSA